MAGAIQQRQLLEPKSLSDALRMMRLEAPLVPLAGCTDLYVALQFGSLAATRFLNLWRLDELRGIRETDEGLQIGALTTHTDLIRSPLVNEALPMLAAAAREIGGVQIQHRGTLGGNVANASPAGDTLPVLSALDAVVELASDSGARRVPFNQFYTGYRKSVAQPDELITGFHFPRVADRQWFRKVGTRAAQAISKVVLAGVGGATPKIALGSVAPTVVRLRRVEEALGNGASIDVALASLDDDIAPIDDVRSTAAYRRQVAVNLVRQFWTEVGTGLPPQRGRQDAARHP